MTCDRRRLSAFLDGELTTEEIQQLREHLESCERCSDDLEAYRGIDRSLGQLEQPLAPGQLRHQVYERLDSRLVRLRRDWGWLLFSPAVPLTFAALLVVLSAAAWRLLLPPGTAPVMTAAFTVQEQPESLDGLRLELVFDRAVAPESLAVAVTIDPPLAVIQRVHENKVELVPQVAVPAGSTYKLTVANVRDQQGNVQVHPVVLNLTTGPTAALTQESPPPPPPPTTPPADQVAGPAAGAPPVPLASGGSASTASRPAGPSPTAVPTMSAPRGVAPGASSALAQAEPTRAAPNGQPATGAPRAAALSPTPAAAAPVVMSQPAPAASQPGRPQIAAVPTQAPLLAAPQLPPVEPIAARSEAGPLDNQPELRRQLGQPRIPEKPLLLGEQAFQGGAMLHRGDSGLVYALIRQSGRWQSFASTWRPGEVLQPIGGTRPPGTWEPMRALGKVWREQPSVKLQLGWAVFEERLATGSIQSYEHGQLLRTPFGVAYVLLDDATWRSLADPRR